MSPFTESTEKNRREAIEVLKGGFYVIDSGLALTIDCFRDGKGNPTGRTRWDFWTPTPNKDDEFPTEKHAAAAIAKFKLDAKSCEIVPVSKFKPRPVTQLREKNPLGRYIPKIPPSK